jgi:hypothetical protein
MSDKPMIFGIDPAAPGPDITVVSIGPTKFKLDFEWPALADRVAMQTKMAAALRLESDKLAEEIFRGPPDFETMKNITPRKLLK